MDKPESIDFETDPTYLAAADWVVRLQQPSLTVEETIEWRQWISADPRNERAFTEIEELWLTCGSLERPREEALTVLTRSEGLEAPSASDNASRRRRHSFPAWGIAAGITLALAAAMEIWLPSAQAMTIETPIGVNRTVHLRDGSLVALGGSSKIEVILDRRRRRVTLLRGEAFFTVSKDTGRRFEVRAGAANVEAVGTEFDVRRTVDRVVVAVLEGQVRVHPISRLDQIAWLPLTSAEDSTEPVDAGYQAVVDSNGTRSTTPIADPSAALAWQHGQLAFDNESLRDVIEDVNRYSGTPLVLADEGLGDIRITGTVSGRDIEGWIASLRPALGIRAERREGRIVLLRPQ